MALTIASLICLILVFAGQTNKNMSLSRDLYFFKVSPLNTAPIRPPNVPTHSANARAQANTKDFDLKQDPKTGNEQVDNLLLSAINAKASAGDIKDFYKVGLWNYCEGSIDDKGVETVTFCSPRKSKFWFNPIEVWQLQGTQLQEHADKQLGNALRAYEKASGWMFTAYIVAICLTAGELVVGILAIFSRWGSFVTALVSSVSSLFQPILLLEPHLIIISQVQTFFIIGAAATSTALFAILLGAFETVFKPLNVKASMGNQMLAVLWLGVVFSVASGFFWTISVCCCSGRSPHNKKVSVEKTPYTYERVASPYMGGHDGGHQLHQMPVAGHSTSGGAYEPYRGQHV
jgi:hypothetical protein